MDRRNYQLHIYGYNRNLKCLYPHNFGYILDIFSTDSKQESHALFQRDSETGTPIPINTKDAISAGEWVDFSEHGYVFIENIRPKPSPETSHEIWKLIGMSSGGMCKVMDPWSKKIRLMLPQDIYGNDRYLHYHDAEEHGFHKSIALQQILVRDSNNAIRDYCDLETKELVPISVISRTSPWSNLNEAHSSLIQTIAGIQPAIP